MDNYSDAPKKDLIQKGFELDKGINRALIAGGLGVAAVGAVITAPAITIFGATVASGSIAGMEVTKRIERSYDTTKTKRQLGKKATKDTLTLVA